MIEEFDKTLRPLTLRFRDPTVEQAYDAYDPEGDTLAQTVLAFVLGAFMVCNPFYWWLQGWKPIPFQFGEIAVGLVMINWARLSRRKSTNHRLRRTLSAVAVLMFGAGLTGLVWISEARFQRVMGTTWLLLMMLNSILSYSWRGKVAVNLALFLACGHWLLFAGVLPTEEVSALSQILTVSMMVASASGYANELVRRRRFLAERALEQILHNTLPTSIAHRLRRAAPGDRIVDRSERAVVLFADIVGFTPFAASRTADELVDTLDALFARFDAVAKLHGLEKIKTIGDAYMAVAGLPEPHADPAAAAAEAALDLQAAVQRLELLGAPAVELRIGIHIGPVVAGVIGRSRFLYDLWGDTVNVASRLESSGLPGKIQISSELAKALEGRYELQRRGLVTLKGRGEVETFFLVGRIEMKATPPLTLVSAA